jgi:hypothetical protein
MFCASRRAWVLRILDRYDSWGRATGCFRLGRVQGKQLLCQPIRLRYRTVDAKRNPSVAYVPVGRSNLGSIPLRRGDPANTPGVRLRVPLPSDILSLRTKPP